MFSYIKGTIENINENSFVLENNGIGYLILASTNTLVHLQMHESAKIFTHFHVREDDVSLFGFATEAEQNAFELLIAVNGIGPKGALAILSTLSVEELQMAILSDDSKAIAKANGIGPKTAQRVVLELKDKFKLEDVFDDLNSSVHLQEEVNNDIITEVAMALTSLGYSNVDALRAVKKVPGYEAMSTEQLLKEALKKII